MGFPKDDRYRVIHEHEPHWLEHQGRQEDRVMMHLITRAGGLPLGFWDCIGLPSKRQVGLTPIMTAEVEGHVAYATWFYDLGRFAVNVVYSEPGQERRGLQDA